MQLAGRMRTHLLTELRDLADNGSPEEIDEVLVYVRRFLACHALDVTDGDLALAFSRLEDVKRRRERLH